MTESKMTYYYDKTYLCDIYMPEKINHTMVVKTDDIMIGYKTLLRNETEKLCEEKGIVLIFPKCEEDIIIKEIVNNAVDTFFLPEWDEEITDEKNVIDKIKSLKSEDNYVFKFYDSLPSPYIIMQTYMKKAGLKITVNRTLLKNWTSDKRVFDKYDDLILFACCMLSTMDFGIKETEELLASAGYMLTDSLKDRIIRCFFTDDKYAGEDVDKLNELFEQANQKIRESNEKSDKKYGKIKEIRLIKNPEEWE